MANRRSFVSAATLLASAPALAPRLVQGADAPAPSFADFLFVQTADSVSYDKTTGKLALRDVSPVTLFFSDRPERIAGNMSTSAFAPFWTQGAQSFLADAPSADISIVEGQKLRQVVALLRSPVLTGSTLTYTARIIKGTMPAKGTDVSLFIDIVGMPLAALWYAAVARRNYRRASIIR
ncbi:hypothetical protein QTH87_18470 [Variovorax sp. J22P168]|uniref:hypothetical protein n=1 Tax=Variovorax jilinensis TaxID=3053513 RepID=UPI002576AB85|nr:hypothetical protein [Variovorax sp. J22P168]MDM0014432.1 hypothetical protein [Variovorax sp. J22P168]